MSALPERRTRPTINETVISGPTDAWKIAVDAGAPPVSQPPAPAISANPAVGSAATETAHGGWNRSPTAYAYQWQLCDGAGSNCRAIAGATSSSYSPTAAQVGCTLRLQETASKVYGTATSPAPSQPAVPLARRS